MRVIKPQRISVLQRVVEHHRRCTLVIGAIVYTPLADSRKLLSEQLLWKEVADHVPGGIIDEGFPKSRAEVLVAGKAFAAGKPVPAVKVEVKISRGTKSLVEKKLAVWGDRHWKGESAPSDPKPFEQMPIDWARAYGGEGYPNNPGGKGFVPVSTDAGDLWVLPNIEDPRAAMTSRTDRPEPAGLSGYDMSWPQRFKKLGKKYDAEWMKALFPGPPLDFDVSFYNAAPADQQIDGFFSGDETIAIDGMHPSKRRVEGCIPRVVLRMYVTQHEPDGAHFREIATRLDTIYVLPEIERAALIFRGTVAVAEDDADDIEHLVLAAEDPAHPRTVEHYRQVLAKRLDKDKGALASMKDEDLMPPVSEGWASKPDFGDMVEMTRLENRTLVNANRGREEALAAGRARLEAAGFHVSAHFAEPEAPPIPDPYDVDAIAQTIERLEAEGETRKAEMAEKKVAMEAHARQAFSDGGFDYDAEMKKAEEQAGGPPDFSADEFLVTMHDMVRIAREGGKPLEDLEAELVDPRYEQVIRDMEARVRDGYLKAAHLMPRAVVDAVMREQLRVQVTAAKDGGESLAAKNLTGADLHDLDLRGIDLSGAMLEGADLSGADLSDAKLAGAVLARADLTRTNLSGADLVGANLGDTLLRDTDLSGAKLDGAVLMKSELAGAILQGASLHGTDFIEVKFTSADLSHVDAKEPLFLQVDLRHVSFVGARLPGARFLQTDVTAVDFTGCELSRAQFAMTRGDRTVFSGASLTTAVFVHECTFNEANFAGADLSGANFRKTSIQRANFARAKLDGASLMACDARGANLDRLSAREALLIRTDFRGANLRGADLLGALMSKAKLQGANLTGANVSRGDMSLVQMDRDTRVAELLAIDTRVDPKYQPPETRSG